MNDKTRRALFENWAFDLAEKMYRRLKCTVSGGVVDDETLAFVIIPPRGSGPVRLIYVQDALSKRGVEIIAEVCRPFDDFVHVPGKNQVAPQ